MHKFKSQKTLLKELTEYTGQKFTVSRGKLLIDGRVITDEDITRRLQGIMREHGLSYLKDEE